MQLGKGIADTHRVADLESVAGLHRLFIDKQGGSAGALHGEPAVLELQNTMRPPA